MCGRGDTNDYDGVDLIVRFIKGRSIICFCFGLVFFLSVSKVITGARLIENIF